MQLFAVHRPMEWCNSRGRLLPINDFHLQRYFSILYQCQHRARKITGVIVSIMSHNFDANSSRCHTCSNPVMYFVIHYWESFSTRCVTLHLVCLPFLVQNDRLPVRWHWVPGSRGPAESESHHPKASIQRICSMATANPVTDCFI